MPEIAMIVGSLNRDTPYFEPARGVGLSVFGFDPTTGRASLLSEDRSVDNPTFLSVAPASRCVYVNSEVFGWHEGLISAYRYDPAAKRLVFLNKQPSLGSITAHNSLDSEARHLLVVNYGMGAEDEGPDHGVVVYPVRPDGGLGPPASSRAHRGRGHHPDRQERAHPHCVLVSPDGRFAMVADLGLDAIFTYGFCHSGLLSPAPRSVLALPPGSGPRQFAFHPGGRWAAVVRELDSTVSSLRVDAESGVLLSVSSAEALPNRATAGNHCSDILFHPNGRFVYAANRGHDSVATFAFEAETGDLRPIGFEACGGRTPRHLAIDPTGKCLLVANQDSSEIAVFTIAEDGRLGRLLQNLSIGSPMCIRFLVLD